MTVMKKGGVNNRMDDRCHERDKIDRELIVPLPKCDEDMY
jgi:hypothetical protein